MERTPREKALKRLLYLLIANTVIIFGSILTISLMLETSILKTALLIGIVLYAFAGKSMFKKGLARINEKFPVE